jgi:hypothetical protein
VARASGAHSKAKINQPWPLPSPMLQMYVSSVLDIIRGMLQVIYMDIAKVDRDDVAYDASVSRHVVSVCSKCFI